MGCVEKKSAVSCIDKIAGRLSIFSFRVLLIIISYRIRRQPPDPAYFDGFDVSHCHKVVHLMGL